MGQGKIETLKEKGSNADILWTNLCTNSPLMYFWKNKNRRFAPANRRFLRYYGLSSVDELIGKTDENMYWHIENGPFHDDEVEVLTQRLLEPGEPVSWVGNSIIFWLIR